MKSKAYYKKVAYCNHFLHRYQQINCIDKNTVYKSFLPLAKALLRWTEFQKEIRFLKETEKNSSPEGLKMIANQMDAEKHRFAFQQLAKHLYFYANEQCKKQNTSPQPNLKVWSRWFVFYEYLLQR